jgi:hypothetical protein
MDRLASATAASQRPVLGCIIVVGLGSLVGCGGSSSQGSSGGQAVITEIDSWPPPPTNDVIDQLFKASQ